MGHRPGDALVEIWNGMPFLSPLWYRGPRLVFLHHVHAEMWGMVLPPTLARLGDTVERRIAPRFYRSSRIVTLSESSRSEIVEMLGLDPTGSPWRRRASMPVTRRVASAHPHRSWSRWDASCRSSGSTSCCGRWPR